LPPELLRGGYLCFPFFRSNLTPAVFFANPINRLDSLFDRVFGGDGGFLSQAWPTLPVAMWDSSRVEHIENQDENPGGDHVQIKKEISHVNRSLGPVS
jgi:hypothetical protein